jgi:hypothetical protein
MVETMSSRQLKQVRVWLLLFMSGLILSGITAIPIQWEIDQIKNVIDNVPWLHDIAPGLVDWLIFVHTGLTMMYHTYPFIVVGTDWLAFAHIVIASAFIGPLRDPIRNVWVIEFGMIACLLVIPAALIFGTMRHLPLLWQLLDCSFGVIGIIPLLFAYRLVRRSTRAMSFAH